MKVHICHVNLASGFSGGERQTLEMIKQQLKLGLRLTVVANPNSPFYEEVRLLNCAVIGAGRFWNAHIENLTRRFDLIHVHDGKAVHWAYIQNKLHKTAYIVTRRIDNPVKKKSYKQYRAAAALIGLSTVICERLREACPHANIRRIPSSPVTYPVDLNAVNDIKEKFNNKFIVIQAANMYEHKGYDVSLRAASLLSEKVPNIQFVFLGDGRLRGVLEEQASSLTNVYFAGKQSNMGDWFAAADILIHPAYSEGLGSVILEAMDSHLPVIAARAGGIPDIIKDSANGYLIEPGNHSQLADKILLLSQNLEHREALVEEIDKMLEPFRIENTVVDYISLYNSCSRA